MRIGVPAATGVGVGLTFAPVEEGAVGGAEVLDEPLAVAREQPGVPWGGVVVGQHERRVVGPADGDRRVAQVDAGAGERPGDDHQLSGGLRGNAARPAASSAAAPRHAGLGRAEEVRPHDAERDDDEDPEQGQKAHPQQEERQLDIRARSVSRRGMVDQHRLAHPQLVAVDQRGRRDRARR